ncbi:MAG: O-antigen ligase family protein [Candidatus Delongbacteria bacterium]|nr:O-antigen ligase family protein [Candidatus Delongbacteria bacterium]
MTAEIAKERHSLLDLMLPLYVFLMVLLDPLPTGHLIANAMFVLVFALFLLEQFSGQTRLRVTPVAALFVLTIIGHLLPILMGKAIYLDLATDGVTQASLLVLLLLFFSSTLESPTRLKNSLLAVTLAFMGTYIWGHLILQRELAGRAMALYENPNAAGICAVYTLFCIRILWDLKRDSNGRPLLNGWLILVSLCAVQLILATQSRKSLLVIVLFLGWEAIKWFRRSRFKIPMLGFAMLALMAFSTTLYVLPDAPVLRRFSNAWRTFTDPTVTASEEDSGILIRLEFYRTGLQIIRENPIIGQGVGAFRALSNQLSNAITEDRVTHSTFLDMYIEGGLLAFVAYVAIFASLVRLLWRRRKERSTYVLLGLFVLFAAGLELGSWRYMDKFKWMLLIAMYYIGRDGLLEPEAELTAEEVHETGLPNTAAVPRLQEPLR